MLQMEWERDVMMARDIFWPKYKLHGIGGDVNVR
jgi:hypothetical protein